MLAPLLRSCQLSENGSVTMLFSLRHVAAAAARVGGELVLESTNLIRRSGSSSSVSDAAADIAGLDLCSSRVGGFLVDAGKHSLTALQVRRRRFRRAEFGALPTLISGL
jgi:hypothetical protein